MVGGLVALVVVLAVASAAGFAVRHRQGRFRAAPAAGRERPAGSAGLPQSAESVQVTTGSAASAGVLSAADLGAPLGAQATLVQFSTRVCAYCGPTRELLTEVARERGGVAFVEIDAVAVDRGVPEHIGPRRQAFFCLRVRRRRSCHRPGSAESETVAAARFVPSATGFDRAPASLPLAYRRPQRLCAIPGGPRIFL